MQVLLQNGNTRVVLSLARDIERSSTVVVSLASIGTRRQKDADAVGIALVRSNMEGRVPVVF